MNTPQPLARRFEGKTALVTGAAGGIGSAISVRPAAKGRLDPMDLRRINDWTLLVGASIEIRQHGLTLCSRHVDAVTDDGTILWLQPPVPNRRLYEKAEFYEAWATEDRTGFHYRVTTGSSPAVE